MAYSAHDENKAQTKLKELAAAAAQLDVEGLVRAECNPVNFEDGRALFERIKAFYLELSKLDLSYLPQSTAESLRGTTERVIQAIARVAQTPLHQGAGARNEALEQLYSQWDDA